jgi:hypothetical protein
VAAYSASLAVVGHEDHGGTVELAALVQKLQEPADLPVSLGQLVEVLGAADPANVAELIGRQELEHEQIRVLLLHHPPRLRGQRAVDLGGRLD